MYGGVDSFCICFPAFGEEDGLHTDKCADSDTREVKGSLVVALYEDGG